MTYHILNGDALKAQLPLLEGVCIVFRECMIDGPLSKELTQDFIEKRAVFIAQYFDTSVDSYYKLMEPELSKLSQINPEDVVHLWFEDDLFCQANLWCCVSFLYQKGMRNLYLIRPNHNEWSGFGRMSTDALKESYKSKLSISATHAQLLDQLWQFYVINDEPKLLSTAEKLKSLIPRITEVVKAHIDRNVIQPSKGKPYTYLSSMKNKGITRFGEVFRSFSKDLGIYGYGDLQVKKMWEELG